MIEVKGKTLNELQESLKPAKVEISKIHSLDKDKELNTPISLQVAQRLESVENLTSEILKNNLDLRRIENRSMVRALVEAKLGKKTAEGSIDRACRLIQNSKGLWKPEPEDNRDELEQIHKEHYSK